MKAYSYNYVILLFLICLILVICRFIVPPIYILSWDVFGYYLYLPAKFIYGDLALVNQEWLTQLVDKYEPSSTLYQLVRIDNGNWVIKYSMGMAFLYAPFFFVAHLIAEYFGYPADGLSLPYQYSVTIGGLIYAIIGLIFLTKVLRHYFNNTTTSLLLIIIFFGTNYFHLTAFDGTLLSHNFLFTLYAILVYSTIKWHDKQKVKYAIIIGIMIGFIILIRPSEIVCIFIPILWNIKNQQTFKEKINLIRKHLYHIFLLILFVFVIITPQLLYWKSLTGSFLFYSYDNPGEGLDLLSPHIYNFLFSFRKGWLIYTPIMIFSILGLYYLFKQKRSIFYAILIFFIIDIYIASSWTCWWYAGGSFSSRSLVPAYVLLSLPLGYFIENIKNKTRVVKYLIIGIGIFFIVLNLFQTWQFEKNIISKERMTRKYYFAIFGKTSVNEEDKKLLLVKRSTEPYEYFNNEEGYSKKIIYKNYFESTEYKNLLGDTNGVFIMNENVPFSQGPDLMYKEITCNNHAWIRASVKIYIPDGYQEVLPLLIVTFHHNNKPYKYRAVGIDKKNIKYNDWNMINMDYLTPEVRSKEDNLKVYVWHRGKGKILIDDLVIDVYEPLNN